MIDQAAAAQQFRRVAAILTIAIGTVACAAARVGAPRILEERLAQEFNYDDPAATEAHFSQIFQEAQRTGDVAAAAEILTQVARAQALQGHLQQAAQTLDRAAAMPTDAVRPRVRLLIERGRLWRRQKQPGQARSAFERAYTMAISEHQDALAADATHMLALLQPYEEAEVWTDRGLTLAEGSAEPRVRRWVGVLANNWGWRLDEAGDHAGAALAFARALAARRIEGDAAEISASEFALAVQLRKLGHSNQALAILDRLLREATSAGELLGEILVERIENLEALGRNEEARRSAEDALRVLTGHKDAARQIERLRTLLQARP